MSDNNIVLLRGQELPRSLQEVTDEAIAKSETHNYLDAESSMAFFYKEDYLVEVKISKTRSALIIHNIPENITVFWHPPAKG